MGMNVVERKSRLKKQDKKTFNAVANKEVATDTYSSSHYILIHL